MTDGELWNELRRVRDKVHDLGSLETTVAAHGKLLERTRRELHALVERVDDMTEADRIAAAVASGIRDDRANRWTFPRKLATVLLSIVVAVPAVHDLAAWIR